MVVEFKSPAFRETYSTEVPCEADPEPFARELIAKAEAAEQKFVVDPNKQLKYCFADGSPLR